MPHIPPPVQQPAGKPRVVFVRQQFSAFGGAELILDRTLAALAARNYPVTLMARSWRESRPGIAFIRCDPPKTFRFLRERRFAEGACKLLARIPDALVQAHERIPCCDIFRAGDGVHAAYLEQRRRTAGTFGKAAIALSLFHRNILRLEREMFASPRLKAVVVNSAMVADDIVHHYGYPRERIHLVPNGIDLRHFDKSARERYRTEMRAQFGVAPGQPVVLFVGSGFARKGLNFAIDAAAANARKPELWVIGGDRHSNAFAARAQAAGLQGRFRLIGAVPDPLPYYAAADALILPSIYDPFPSTVIEALACGLPVVTSTGCGARDVVSRLDPGLVSDVLDPQGLAAALDCALDLAARTGTIDAASALAAEFSLDAMVDRMIVLYERLVPGQTGRG